MDALPTGDIAPFRRPLFLSPHLDDAVFACGRLLDSLPGALVATVFAGRPEAGQALTQWDAAAGFREGDDVVGARRAEDRAALAVLGAEARWLEFRDAQYGAASLAVTDLADSLRQLCRTEGPDAIFLPLGLYHADHRLTCQAALSLLPDFPACHWFIYADAIYRALPGRKEQALEALRQQGHALRPVRFGELADAEMRKRLAIAHYASQLRALATPGRPGTADLAAAEAYWAISPPTGRLAPAPASGVGP